MHEEPAYLSHNEELGEFGETDDVIEELLLVGEEVRPANKLHRIVALKRPLIPFLDPIGLADDLVRISLKLRILRPGAIPDVVLHKLPVPSIVS